MGGFFATCLAEQYDLRAVLINPAVNPGLGLSDWLGENQNYVTGERWIFESHHIDEYKDLYCPELKFKKITNCSCKPVMRCWTIAMRRIIIRAVTW